MMVLSVTLLAQAPDPFDHQNPQPGWFCAPEDSRPEHVCHCLGMVTEPLCGETEEERIARQESSACRTYCHRERCTCMTLCKES